MQIRSSVFLIGLALAGCASPPPPSAIPQAAVVPAAGVPAPGVHGTILAMRPVPAKAPEPARVLLAGFAGRAPSAAELFEFIVRTESGGVIAVVQPRAPGLHAGATVRVIQGTQTRIDAMRSE